MDRRFCVSSAFWSPVLRFAHVRPRYLLSSFRLSAAAEATTPKDFVTEMRELTMSLHTKDQKDSGKDKTPPKPFQKWEYTREGYLQFLVESRHVYQAFEQILATNENYSFFRETGLHRVASLDHDIDWISAEYDLPIPALLDDGPGQSYSKLLQELSVTNVPAFICHLYNFYLAHTAGGRMIGKKVADTVFEGAFGRMAFYQYERNVKSLVQEMKASINAAASDWSREQKDVSLGETEQSFEYSGAVLRTMFNETMA